MWLVVGILLMASVVGQLQDDMYTEQLDAAGDDYDDVDFSDYDDSEDDTITALTTVRNTLPMSKVSRSNNNKSKDRRLDHKELHEAEAAVKHLISAHHVTTTLERPLKTTGMRHFATRIVEDYHIIGAGFLTNTTENSLKRAVRQDAIETPSIVDIVDNIDVTANNTPALTNAENADLNYFFDVTQPVTTRIHPDAKAVSNQITEAMINDKKQNLRKVIDDTKIVVNKKDLAKLKVDENEIPDEEDEENVDSMDRRYKFLGPHRRFYKRMWRWMWGIKPTTTEPSSLGFTTHEDFGKLAGAEIVAKCFVCGLTTPEIPRSSYCSDAFAGEFIPLVAVDPLSRGFIGRYRKYCRYFDVPQYFVNGSQPRSVYGRFTGGCSVRWIDLSGVYTQRACRNTRRAMMGAHFASKRMAKLEMALKEIENGCMVSPMSSLVPLSRGISLYARFHVCVCTGSWCNRSAPPDQSFFHKVLILVWTMGQGLFWS